MNFIGEWKAGATPSKTNIKFYKDGSIPWLLTGDLNNGMITDIPNKITNLALEKTSVKLNPAGTVLIAMYGATIGKLGVLTFPSTTNQACCACEVIQPFYNMYLFYFLMENKMNFIKQGEGGAQPNISREKIIKTFIPIPPLNEQYRIVERIHKIEPLITKYKKAEEQLYELNSNIKQQLKKSILLYAIEGKLVPQDPNDEPASALLERIRKEKQKLIAEGKIKKDKNESIIYRRDNSYYEKLNRIERCIDDELPFEIPNNWCWARLNSIGEWKAGATPSKTNIKFYKDGSIPWLLTGDLNNGMITDIPNKITNLALKETSVKLNPAGTILIAMYGATIGKLGILSYPATTNQACCACEVIQPFYNMYLFYFLMANKMYFIKQGEGGAQPNISREKIIKTFIPIPPLNEQYAIVNRLRQITKLI